MGALSTLNRWSGRLAWIDVKLLGVVSLFFGLLIAKAFPSLRKLSYPVMIGVIGAALIHPVIALLGPQGERDDRL